MAGPAPIGPSIVSHKTYENNLQQVGGQRQARTPRQDAPAPTQDPVGLAQADALTLSREGAENAAHVGGLQALGLEEHDDLDGASASTADLIPGSHREETEEGLTRTTPTYQPASPPSSPSGASASSPWEAAHPGTLQEGLSPYVPGLPGPGAPSLGPEGGLPGSPGAPGFQPPAMSQADQAQRAQQLQQDQQEMQRLMMQMAADRQKWMMEMWKIMQDTQTKIYEIMQSAILFRAQAHDRIHQAWSQVIRGA